jgi:acetyltransferase
MAQTRVYAALKGGRGQSSVDIQALEKVLIRFSQLVAEQRRIKESDINPLLVSGDQIVALDARMILHDAQVADEKLPALAIRPYPQHYAISGTLAEGTSVLVRSIRPEDEPMLAAFHQTLSDQSVYYRYFAALTLLQRTNHARLARLCFIDYDREVALVAVHDDRVTGRTEIIGVGRLCKAHGKNEAEFAVVVSDRWQRQGLGTLLLRKLVEIGREERLAGINGMVLAENQAMRRLCERLGFRLRYHAGQPELEASLRL